jgi:hypothetical protein
LQTNDDGEGAMMVRIILAQEREKTQRQSWFKFVFLKKKKVK